MQIILEFNAVDYLTTVYINKEKVGIHEGGYTPFQFNVTNAAHSGQNEILLRVLDPQGGEKGTEGISYWHIPHGKQSWYVQNSGIWQSVRIRILPDVHVSNIKISTNNAGEAAAQIRLNKWISVEEILHLTITDPVGSKIHTDDLKLPPGVDNVGYKFNIPDPRLWDLDNPNLYTMHLAQKNGFSCEEKFGFREFTYEKGRLFLNDRPYYMIGALDQDFYPETSYSTPSDSFLFDELRKAKKLGLNLLRCHIKVPDKRYLKFADEIGLLIWYEIPNWDVHTPEAGRRAAILLDEMLDRDWNHPSLVIISLINESWGLDLKQEEQRAWLKDEFSRVKSKNSGRLIVDNSACWGNFHLKTDINDYHTYWAIPENRVRFDETLKAFSQRPGWLFSAFGDADEQGTEPLILSEFGNWGLPIVPAEQPWWLRRDFSGITVSLPDGYKDRFKKYNYEMIFGSYEKLAEASQWNQFDALKWEIEQIRLYPEISGYVITEFTDLNWECNGLLDMWRNFKAYYADLAAIQQPLILIPRPEKYNWRAGDTIQVNLFCSSTLPDIINNAELRWKSTAGNGGQEQRISVRPAGLTPLPPIRYTVPFCDRSITEHITIELLDHTGKRLAINKAELFIYPEKNKHRVPRFKIYDPYKKFSTIENLSDFTTDEKYESPIITNVLDNEILDHLRSGSNILCLVDEHTVSPDTTLFRIIPRKSQWYDGNWASNLNWIRFEHPVFNDICSSPLLGFRIADISPEWIITDLSPQNFKDVLAGMFVGWLHLNSGYIVQMRSGSGRLLLCTFPLAEKMGKDVFAAELMANLLDWLVTTGDLPETELK